MNKLTQLVFGIIVVSLLTFIAFKDIKENLGNLNVNENAYSSASTYSTSTLTNSSATLLLSKATSSRTYAKICNPKGADIAFIYKQATSTGVSINAGTGSPIFASSSTSYPQLDACFNINSDDPYLGQVWGIVNATSTLTIESVQE